MKWTQESLDRLERDLRLFAAANGIYAPGAERAIEVATQVTKESDRDYECVLESACEMMPYLARGIYEAHVARGMLLGIHRTAELMGVTTTTLKNWHTQNRHPLPAIVTKGGWRRYLATDVLAYLEREESELRVKALQLGKRLRAVREVLE